MDYFVVGVSIALVGYLGTSVEPGPVDFTTAGLERFSLILFLAAAVAGVKRIESVITALRMNQQIIYREESAGSIMSAVGSGGLLLNRRTGDLASAEELGAAAADYNATAKAGRKLLDRHSTKAGRWYSARNGFLLGGLAVLVASRLLPLLGD